MLIYVFTDVFLYQNIATNKGKNLSWIKFVFRSPLCSLYLHVFAQISLIIAQISLLNCTLTPHATVRLATKSNNGAVRLATIFL